MSGKLFAAGMVLLVFGLIMLSSFIFTPASLFDFLLIFGGLGLAVVILGITTMYIGIFREESEEEASTLEEVTKEDKEKGEAAEEFLI